MPVGGVSPPLTRRWRPELSDEFNGTTLEGVTGGVLGANPSLQTDACNCAGRLILHLATLGSKWLFKQEDPELWSLPGNGALQLRTDAKPSIESAFPTNMLVQRPTSAYVHSLLHQLTSDMS